ncbi:MAG: hypothetical protein HYX69_03445 [Planctomycetia bacterium]|nr:hypothetical protein [Planctomycetia bacterium]
MIRLDRNRSLAYCPPTMRLPCRLLSVALIALVVAAAARADDDDRPQPPEARVLLLRNGQVLSGQVTRVGNMYYVTLASGEIRLSADAVELVCRDLEEGYERKRTSIDPDKLTDHLDLALWCIRQELFDDAASEIAAAATIDPRHPRVGLIERQLKLARERPAQSPPRKAAPAAAAPTSEELDRMLRGMPRGTVETFANTIQPLLLNNCTGAGCHGQQSEGRLQLLRTQLGQSASRRLTQRNLYAVLQLIDRHDPPASPLLTVPIAPHGTAKAAIFTGKEVAQYRQLVQWIMRVAQAPAPEQPQSIESPGDELLQRLPGRRRDEPPPTASTTDGTGERRAASDKPSRSRRTSSEKKKPPADEPPTDAAAAVDPLDPEVFNRRFFPPQ